MVKKGKNFKIESHLKFNSSYGTVDYTTNDSMYIDISSWLEPKYNINVDNTLKIIKKTIKKIMYDTDMVGVDTNSFIVNLDLRASGIKPNKKSYMNINITLYSDLDVGITNNNVITLIDIITNNVYDNFSNKFTFNKRKNK